MAEKRPPLPYGPFTAEVRRFLQRLATLTPAEEASVVAEYQVAVASAEHQAAERALGSAIARSGREQERDALGGPLLQMLRVQHQPEDPDVAQSLSDDVPPFRPLAEPALAALLAILMQDVLPAELFAQLYAPFARTITRTSVQA